MSESKGNEERKVKIKMDVVGFSCSFGGLRLVSLFVIKG